MCPHTLAEAGRRVRRGEHSHRFPSIQATVGPFGPLHLFHGIATIHLIVGLHESKFA